MSASGCPCGSRLPYSGCCEPLHEGNPALTALALMRSRFSAYALGRDAYVLATWHPSTRPRTLSNADRPEWRRLQIVDTVAGGSDDEDGIVEFRATHRTPTGIGVLHERSRFVRDGGRWYYLDGEIFD